MSGRIAVIAAVILCLVLVVSVVVLSELCANPVISGGKELPTEFRNAIQSQAGGLYSRRLPLVPVVVTVEELQEEMVLYTIHYFPFGTVGMSYHPDDGYNMEKTLTRLQ